MNTFAVIAITLAVLSGTSGMFIGGLSSGFGGNRGDLDGFGGGFSSGFGDRFGSRNAFDFDNAFASVSAAVIITSFAIGTEGIKAKFRLI